MPNSLCRQEFFQTIRSRLWHLINFLCAVQVNDNAHVSEEPAKVKAMNKVLKLGMHVHQQTN
ncbi:hypothetical protein [Candidatus Enterovibrio escicola]|uniref:hypothetical protein n=1 Tax=Candidatus Enterovibrio escicola TaxID=1927127 RepID=UPI0011BA55AE|nr:hypothetical protein [Candidatus Enterovibrio escacola]